jgi:hypothetical protein
MNTYRAGHVCLPVCIIQFKNWMDLDEIWYGYYAIGHYSKVVLFSFPQLIIPTWQANKLMEWDQL